MSEYFYCFSLCITGLVPISALDTLDRLADEENQ